MRSSKVGALLLLLGAMLAQGPAQSKPLPPVGNWTVGYDNGLCMLWRSYGRRERPTNLFIEPSLIGGATRLFIMYPGGRGLALWGAGPFKVDGRAAFDVQTLDFPTKNKTQRIIEILLPSAQLAPILTARTWALDSKLTGRFEFELGALAGMIPQLDACVAKRIAEWGLDAARAAPPAARANAEGDAAQVGLFGSDDYPKLSLYIGSQGKVSTRSLVGPDGRVIDCSIVASSGDAVLDHMTCNKIKSRARFTPARDASGSPVHDIFDQSVSWVIQR